ncbi:hypothetical protein F4780DRAFT_779424 [Xylariomycetidae sp. FL0641]|nr:hypothetical protein F4780DRAFT_779424 [Xylariomycetidae sp. FL0641]
MAFANVLRSLAARPRSSTKGPLEIDEEPPLASPSLPSSPQIQRLSGGTPQASARSSLSGTPRSPARSPAPPLLSGRSAPAAETPAVAVTAKDFSFLQKPELYHALSPLTVPAAFRTPARQPPADAAPADLLAGGHFRAAAIAAAQALTGTGTGTGPANPPAAPADHARIFALLYVRLAALCLLDGAALAAQEAKALEDLSSAFYLDALTGAPLVPWPLRLLGVRLQSRGFADPRRAVMSYYELAREARAGAARARARGDPAAAALWRDRLADLAVRVAGALVEMDDLAGAAEHLRSLRQGPGGRGRLAASRALLWLHLGDVDAARRCVAGGGEEEEGEKEGEAEISHRVVDALADMADGEYETALVKWRALREEMQTNGFRDEMIGVNLAVCLLYTARIDEGREVLEGLVNDGMASHTLLFNLSTMYELCTDRAKIMKVKLAERVADMEPSDHGWEKTNADFKL